MMFRQGFTNSTVIADIHRSSYIAFPIRSEGMGGFRIGFVCRGGETVDALRSGRSVRKDVRVRLPPSAPCRPPGVSEPR